MFTTRFLPATGWSGTVFDDCSTLTWIGVGSTLTVGSIPWIARTNSSRDSVIFEVL